jgi:hypothetical protein
MYSCASDVNTVRVTLILLFQGARLPAVNFEAVHAASVEKIRIARASCHLPRYKGGLRTTSSCMNRKNTNWV